MNAYGCFLMVHPAQKERCRRNPSAEAWGVSPTNSPSHLRITTNNHKEFFIVKGAIFSENVTTIFIM